MGGAWGWGSGWGNDIGHFFAKTFPISGNAPDWSGAITALATLGLVIIALGALRQIGEAKKSRYATTGADFSRRWDEPEMIRARQLVRSYASSADLQKAYMAAWANLTSSLWLELAIVPNYFEDLAILMDTGGIDPEFVERSLGDVLRDQWTFWKPTADAVMKRERDDDPWPNFRQMAADMSKP